MENIMVKNYKIRAPYFEIGPKCFMWGERMLKLAKAVDKIAELPTNFMDRPNDFPVMEEVTVETFGVEYKPERKAGR